MGVFFDYELLAVKEGKNHRDYDGGGIVKSMEQGCREQNPFFHGRSELGYIPNPKGCQFKVAVAEELD